MHSGLASESGNHFDENGQPFAAGPLRAAAMSANLHEAHAAGSIQVVAMTAS
jgi:hypothetical protein